MEPSRLLSLEVLLFLGLLTALLVYRMLTRRVSLSGLFANKQTGQSMSPERLQLFVATLAMSAQYVGQVAHGDGKSMPDVSAQWLTIFGASSGIYAAVKAAKMWWGANT